MPDSQKTQSITAFSSSNLLLAFSVIMILGIMILPLPTFMMDMFLVMNITGALVMLFVALYIPRPLEFSVFPGLLLLVTLFRLSLNVATTRLILSQGYAGEIIKSFGTFVVQGNYAVGVVIFLILVIINFVVITKGSSRIAEVSARFTLDAMPGKQMAIDADLNAGLIDDQDAQYRRKTITEEAEFYGAMDGAAKFVRGDAIAGLIITSINIIGGLAIGVLQRGLPLNEAASIYTLLTIGDGLVAQIPALIISTAAGMIITKATSETDMGSDIAFQVSKQPRAIFITAAVLALMGLVPGLPFFPFIIISSVLAFAGYTTKKQIQDAEQALIAAEEEKESEENIPEDKIESYLHPDPIEIEIGYGLIPLVDSSQGGNILGRITTIRKSIAMEMGVIVPPIRIRDNIQLSSNKYVIKMNGIPVSSAEVMMDSYLVLNPGEDTDLVGIPTVEPTFKLPSLWVNEYEKEKAEVAGYTVVETPAVVATHLMEVIKLKIYKLLDRQMTQKMLDHLKETYPAVVEGVVPDLVPLGTVTQILKNLLQEKIPIRNLVIIMETIADHCAITKDADVLTEYVRGALTDIITDYYKQNDNEVTVTTLDPRIEDKIITTINNRNGNTLNLGFTPKEVKSLFESIGEKVEKMLSSGKKPLILVSPQIRRHIRNFVEPVLPNLTVLSYSELTPDTNVKTVGVIQFPHES